MVHGSSYGVLHCDCDFDSENGQNGIKIGLPGCFYSKNQTVAEKRQTGYFEAKCAKIDLFQRM